MSDVAAFSKMLSLLARSKDVSVEKLTATIAAVETERARLARLAFTAAFLALQGRLPEIDENGAMVRDGQQISKFSKFEDIQRVLKPLLIEFGFTLTFHNDYPAAGFIEVVTVVTHKDGYHTEHPVRLHDDDSMASRNQAMGSSQSYAMRYGVLGAFNIITRGADVDMGDVVGAATEFVLPAGVDRDRYMTAVKRWEKAAIKGRKTFTRSMQHSPVDLVALLMGDARRWQALKAIAEAQP